MRPPRRPPGKAGPAPAPAARPSAGHAKAPARQGAPRSVAAAPANKATDFVLRGEHITLDALLKATGLADSGGAAKMQIASGAVRVNGEVELRRGRKLRAGDIVTLAGTTVRILAGASDGDALRETPGRPGSRLTLSGPFAALTPRPRPIGMSAGPQEAQPPAWPARCTVEAAGGGRLARAQPRSNSLQRCKAAAAAATDGP